MAFRKRNIPVGSSRGGAPLADDAPALSQAPGTRSSPLTSHTTTSTGTPSLDGLLGGHGGVVLGCSILIGEHGTTDYAGALLRYYAAEGILHGHTVHVVGMGEGWVRELPGVAEARYQKTVDTVRNEKPDLAAQERMKIAWRYERLGQAGERALPDRSLVRTLEMLADCVLEVTPFPHQSDEAQSAGDGKSPKEERPQGLVKVLKLPLATERGEGGAGAGNSIGEDLAFTLSRRKFAIAEFSLPPVEGDQEAQKEAGKVTAKDVEF
ncbi:hypothetical protein B0A48_04946 [Cryoendolithus antarcticus]|uniref:Elongator complex protein 4 n=1 Tax=Cryoendolithus antarcticus TaxID=1507870 RepID=A0A1V8TE48_9PEZI|nr:hypothetical protein B0A48_04946 [Cryoendolithus antarcticus]